MEVFFHNLLKKISASIFYLVEKYQVIIKPILSQKHCFLLILLYVPCYVDAACNLVPAHNDNELVNLREGTSVVKQFWAYDPSCLSYVENNRTYTITSSITVFKRSDNSQFKSVGIVDPSKDLGMNGELFSNTFGEYKVVYEVVRTERERSEGKVWVTHTTFTSSKNVNYYKNSPPTVSLSNASLNVQYGQSVDVTVTVEDSAGSLDAYPTFLTEVYLWTVDKQACDIDSAVKKRCVYRLRPDTFPSNIKQHGFKVFIRNRYGLQNSTTGTVNVYENNLPPSFSVVNVVPVGSVSLGASLSLTATAKDLNISAAHKLTKIRWCSSTSANTSNCSLIKECVVANLSESYCNYSHSFNVAGTYSVWAEASDSSTITKSVASTIDVTAPPSVIFSTVGDFRLGNTVSLSAIANSASLTSLQICRGGTKSTHCNIPIKSCTTSTCSTAFHLDPSLIRSEAQDFYAVVTDSLGQKSYHGLVKNVIGSYALTSPQITGQNYPNSLITLKGNYNLIGSTVNPVSSIALLVNEQQVSQISTTASPFSFNYTLGDLSTYKFRFKLVDSSNVAVTSDITHFTVESARPVLTPKVTASTAISEDGKISLSLTSVPNTSEYLWYEYRGSCPNNSEAGLHLGNTGAPVYLIQKYQYQDNGNYCYCAQAKNPNGTGPLGTGSLCAPVVVAIPDSVPGLTRFDPTLSLSQTHAYTLKWLNDNQGAHTFRLERTLGQPGQDWTQVAVLSAETKRYEINTLQAGDVSYRVIACNRDNVCGAGQIITVNHQLPYIHNASYRVIPNTVTGQIVIDGLGLLGINQAQIQVRNTAEVFTFPVMNTSATRSQLTPNQQVIDGLLNGGLRLSVGNAVGVANIEFDNGDSLNRPDIDLIKASPTVSDNGIVYVSSGQKLHALNEMGQNLSGWPFSLPSGTPENVNIPAAPTLDKDININDVIYFGATDRNVYKLDHRTNILWKTGIQGEIHAKVQLLNEPDPYNNNQMRQSLYVGAVTNGKGQSGLYALDPTTGQERFMYPLLSGVKQEPKVFSNGDMHITTEDDQLHIINRSQLSPFALRWQDVDSSLVLHNYQQQPNWEIPENADIPLNTLIGLFYGILGRTPSKQELMFFAFASWSGADSNEITAAFLGGDDGLSRFPIQDTHSQFVDKLFGYLFPSETNKTSASGLTRGQWIALLDDNHPRSEIAYRLIQSDDYFSYSANVAELVTRVFFDHCNCNEVQDSDNDGVTDSLEIELGFNPLDPFDVLLDEPALNATEPMLGDFYLNWQVINSPVSAYDVYYVIDESINQQPAHVIAGNHNSNSYDLIKASGSYSYRAKACIHANICSQWSNTVDVSVGDSVVEAGVQPEAAPILVADYNPPSDDEIETSARFGMTTGDFSVSESGAATYAMPFALPQGIAGVAPQLGLSYNSQSGEGVIGLGWDLQGSSAISRCGSSRLTDGFNSAIALDETDNFCLDGQRLLLKTGIKGQANSTYVTEIENQLVITYQSDDSFTVEGKDKSLRVYGGSIDSKLQLNSGDADVTLSWFISKSQDNLRQESNEVRYEYASGLGNHEKLLKSVTYSGNHVDFDYEYNGKVKTSGYLKGNRLSKRADLLSVLIYNHNNDLVREYQLAHRDNPIGQRQLTSIKECGLAGVCKKGVAFKYRDVFTQDNFDISWRQSIITPAGEYLRHAMVLDTNNDGVSELVTLTQVSSTQAKLCIGTPAIPATHCRSFSIYDDLQQNARLVPTDPDGDGLMNFLINTDNDQPDGRWIQFDVLQNGGLSLQQVLPLSGDTSLGINIKAMDVNGDGYNDLVETNQSQGASDAEIFVRIWDKTNHHYLAPVDLKLSNSYVIKPQISAGWQSVDINQDGISDIMAWGAFEQSCNPTEDASCKVIQGENLHFFATDPKMIETKDADCERRIGGKLCDRFYYSATPYATISIKGKHAIPLDLNGDSLTDIVVYNSDTSRWQYHLNTGSGFLQFSDFENNADLSSSVAPMVADIDSDGRIELIFHNKNDQKWYRYEWTHNEVEDSSGFASGGFTRVGMALSDWAFDPPTDDVTDSDYDPTKVEYGQFTDADNDGLADFIYKQGQLNRASQSLNFYHGGNRVAHPGLLSTVTTGSGIVTHIEYGSMTDPTLYNEASGLPEPLIEQDAIARVLNLAGSGTLVKSVATDAPFQTQVGDVKVNYLYEGSRAQFGRGNLGFESITTVLFKDGIGFTTKTEYAQEFPLTGMPLRTSKTAAGTLISVAENRYYSSSTDIGDGYLSFQLYQQESRDCQANVDTITGTNVSVSSFNCQQLITVQDEHANVIDNHTGHYDVVDASAFVAMTDVFSQNLKADALKSISNHNEYGSSEFSRTFGRLSRSEAIHSRGTESMTRTSSFDYFENGMLKQEVIEPDGACDAKLITDYDYDIFGNLTNKTVHNDASCTPSLSRESLIGYDEAGRYVTQSTENGILSTKVLARNALGQATQVSNVDGQISRALYDAFGTEVYSYSPTGAQSTNLNMACDDGVGGCFVMTQLSVNGEVQKKQYRDTAGRAYKESAVDVLGNWHSKTQSYDRYGRVLSVTEPGLASVTNSYDALDRVIQTYDPNIGTTVSQTYTDRQQTNSLTGDIPGGEQTKTTTYNALGEAHQITDAQGNTLTYTYEVQGNLATVHSSVDDKVLSDIDYDSLGRKTAMVDENRGNWTYQYDAMGQLVRQADARGVITEVYYDNLGRKVHQKVTGTAEVASEEMYWVYGTGNNKHRLLYESSGSWRRDIYYDHIGRAVASLTNLDGTTNCVAKAVFNSASKDLRIVGDSLANPIDSRCVIQQSTFDEHGRLFQQFDDYRRKQTGEFVEARGLRNHYQHGQVVKQQEAREGTAGRFYHEILSINQDGLLSTYRKGNQAMSLYYDAAKRLNGINSGNHIQAETYSFDSIHNLSSRSLTAQSSQTFGYDALNRVTHVDGVQRYFYAANGNLTEKEGWTLEYANGAADPLHAVTKRSKAGEASETYGYDANGNQTWGKKNGVAWRSFSYSGRNKATRIDVGGKLTEFSYDANNQRFKRVDVEGTIFYVGNLELTIKAASASGSQQSHIKRYIGDAMQTYYADGNAMLRWLFKDHLGSVVAITNDSGKLVKRFSYDVFGVQSEIIPTEAERAAHYENTALSSLALAQISASTRGYTGHEPVDVDGDKRIIHMNGRMYDAALGRMLQADPVVQAPDNLQNYNSYSYVINNPLNATDPSGYSFKKLFRAIADIPILNAAISVVFAVYCQACLVAYNAMSTYSVTGSLKSAFISGLTTAIMPGGGSAGRVLASAAIGGLSSKLQGGDFGHGFISAGIGAAFGGRIKVGNQYANVIVAAVIGGTISKITGGKFANGAYSGAFAAAFTSNLSEQKVNPKHALYAEMSEKAYEGKVGDKVGSYKISKVHSDNTGLRAALFVDGSGNKVLAYAGTDFTSWGDLKANILQGMGIKSAQYTNAVDIARSYGAITFIGHSLGGGLASAAAIYTQGTGVVFNAAGLHDNILGGLNRSRGNITHYHSGYDAISVINAMTPTSVPGTQINMGHGGVHGIGSMCKVMGTSC